MIVKLLTEHHLEFLSLKRGYTGLSESTHVKMPHCWKSHALAHLFYSESPESSLSTFAFDTTSSRWKRESSVVFCVPKSGTY